MLSTYKQLRQSVNMCAGSVEYLVMIIFCMAINLALKLVCRPGSLLDIRNYVFVGLRIPYPAFFFFQCPSLTFMGGTNKPSV